MNLPRRTFLSRILAGAVAAPALTRIIEGSTKPEPKRVIPLPKDGATAWLPPSGEGFYVFTSRGFEYYDDDLTKIT